MIIQILWKFKIWFWRKTKEDKIVALGLWIDGLGIFVKIDMLHFYVGEEFVYGPMSE